ncbi:HAD family hydrolase [archaeon]|jgi:D-glycero-D-manno-heptose 1,7-bisphosphate phosphatase|nr:HAD family hydrolase [archaeon]
MIKAIFLDRDGTINKDSGHVHKIEDLVILDKVIEGLKLFQEMGYFPIIVTNQAGIGKGYYQEKDFQNFNNSLVRHLKKHGIKIEQTYFCPHAPKEECLCRKPNVDLLYQAKGDYNINFEESYFIGDKNTDILAGKKVGCKTLLVLTGETKNHLEARKCSPDFIAKNLLDAARWVKEESKL